jgi:WXG100 family type VII secretion target
MSYIKASFPALADYQSAVSESGHEWERMLDDLATRLEPVRASWTGAAAAGFDRSRADWESAAHGLREVLREVEDRVGTIQDNYRSAIGASAALWQGGGGAAAEGTVAMSAPPSGSGDGFEITVDDLRSTVATFKNLQDQLVHAARDATDQLRGIVAMGGDDRILAVWRDRYDPMVASVLAALNGVVAVFGGIAVKLTLTANTYLDAEEASGAPHVDRLPPPGAVESFRAPIPPSSTGPGPEAHVPEFLAQFWPNAWPDRMEAAGRIWTRLADTYADILEQAESAFLALTVANNGETFSLITGYWRMLKSPGLATPDRPFNVLYLAMAALGSAPTALAETVRAAQDHVIEEVQRASDEAWLAEIYATIVDVLMTRGASERIVWLATLVKAGVYIAPYGDQYQQMVRAYADAHAEDQRAALELFATTHPDATTEGPRLREVTDIAMGELRGKWDQVQGDHPHPDQINCGTEAQHHILDGDPPANPNEPWDGGHGPGRGRPGKSEFPGTWSDGKVIDESLSLARNPDTPPVPGNRPGTWKIEGWRDGVKIRVIVDPQGNVITAYPLDGTGVVRNPR